MKNMGTDTFTDLLKKAAIAIIISGATAWALWWAANLN